MAFCYSQRTVSPMSRTAGGYAVLFMSYVMQIMVTDGCLTATRRIWLA